MMRVEVHKDGIESPLHNPALVSHARRSTSKSGHSSPASLGLDKSTLTSILNKVLSKAKQNANCSDADVSGYYEELVAGKQQNPRSIKGISQVDCSVTVYTRAGTTTTESQGTVNGKQTATFGTITMPYSGSSTTGNITFNSDVGARAQRIEWPDSSSGDSRDWARFLACDCFDGAWYDNSLPAGVQNFTVNQTNCALNVSNYNSSTDKKKRHSPTRTT